MSEPFHGFLDQEVPSGAVLRRGKVRDVLDWGTHVLLTATDRISAFDRILGSVPDKGEILHQLSVWWMEQACAVMPNALVASLGPRTAVMRKAQPLSVEIVVRGYLTGSAWRDYDQARELWGLPSGLSQNQKLPRPYLTPTTKAEAGHDLPISPETAIMQGLVSKDLWEQVEKSAVGLFEMGAKRLAERGLLLVDTKYEMGLIDGELVLIDEIHTPDSSRFWYADSYPQAFADGRPPRQLDKEVFRAWLLEQGWKGEGDPPAIPESVWNTVRDRYLEAWSAATGTRFQPSGLSRADLVTEVTSWRP